MISKVDSQLLNRKISDIIDFLQKKQNEDGEFRTLRFFHKEVPNYAQKTEYPGWYSFGKCVFCTANIVHHLKEIEMPYVKEIRKKGCDFLQKGIENGLFRYVPSYDRAIHFPVDIDDTCLTLAVLKENGYQAKGNVPMILGNATSNGNFYTWFIPRWRHLSNPYNFFWLTTDFVRSYRKAKSYGENMKAKFKEHKQSAEPAITANVILYLGENNITKKFIDSLIEQTADGSVTLQYYANILFLYFHIARLYRQGIQKVGVLREKIFSYLSETQQQNGEIENGFNTALAALILMYFNYWKSEVLERAIQYLVVDKMHEESWKPMPCCNDLDGIFSEGSAEYTATLYLESLYRFQNHTLRHDRQF